MMREEYAWATFARALTQLRSKATYKDTDEHAVLNVLLTFVKDLGTHHTLEVIVEELYGDAVVNNECQYCTAPATQHHCVDCGTTEIG